MSAVALTVRPCPLILTNVAMALRGDAYAGVKKNAELQKVKLRAEVIINVERGMSDADRRNPEWFPHYVQTLELLPSREPHHFKEGTDSAQLDRPGGHSAEELGGDTGAASRADCEEVEIQRVGRMQTICDFHFECASSSSRDSRRSSCS